MLSYFFTMLNYISFNTLNTLLELLGSSLVCIETVLEILYASEALFDDLEVMV